MTRFFCYINIHNNFTLTLEFFKNKGLELGFLFLLLATSLLSCEDTINVDLNEVPPQLVVDAPIIWIKGTPGNEQEIKLSLTAPYFDVETPPATGAYITIGDKKSNLFIFSEVGQTGRYVNNSFIPSIDETYTLTIIYNNNTYSATETLKSVVEIQRIEQNNTGGFSGNETEIKAYYTDPYSEENYYMFEFRSVYSDMPWLEVYEDEFYNGNTIFGFYTEEALTQGDYVIVRNYGISRQFYEYMYVLLQQTSSVEGDPFETHPATVRGNVTNLSNSNLNPLGFFRLSEVSEITYIVQ